MKKQLCKLAIFALLLSTASCADEKFVDELSGGETTVTFNAQLPTGLQTRVAGDGLTANTLSYAVYEHGKTTPVITSEDEVTFVNRQASVSLRLAKGKTYDFLFWADAYGKNDPKNPYKVDFNTQTLTVNYENALSNDESRDAFFGTANVTVKGAVSKNITLKRPFAQLNIGTNDMAAAQTAGLKTDALQTSVKVYGIFNSMNLMTGMVDGSMDVTFGSNAIPNEKFTVEGRTFDYLALNYLLVSDQKGLVKCEFTYSDGATNETRTIDNVPVQRNYRTNIFGSLLTGSVDLGITIVPDFDTPDFGVAAPWDGKTVTPPTETDNDILISSPAEWVWLKTHSRNGKNIKLTANLDFGGFEVKGIGAPAVFDGQGYIMSNMVLLPGGSNYSNGLFQGDATSGGVTVKNVTFENITAECSDPAQGYVGVVFGDLQNGNLTLENVHVKDADLCGVQSVGGLVGFVASGRTVSINNCSVEGGYIHNYPVADESGYVAGLVGRPVGTVNVKASEVKDTQIRGYYAPRRGETTIAAVVGGQATVDGATVTNVDVEKISMDDVVLISTAEQLNTLNVTDKVVLLTADIDFGSAAMAKTIEIFGNSTFDGQGHKISNVTTAMQGGNYATSLFRGDANGGNKVIRNLVIENLTTPEVTFAAAAIWSDMQNSANIEIDNVHIYNSQIGCSSINSVGGFVGFVGSGSEYVVIKNSSINSSAINKSFAYRAGALVGRAYGCGVTCENVVVDNVTVCGSAAKENTLVGGENDYTGTVTIK